jgi:hypothetical protein
MHRLVLATIFVGMSAGMIHAGAIDITVHEVGDPDIGLSSILGIWGTPGTSGTEFDEPGTGTNEFGALDLYNDTGATISSIEIYAYGTVGSLSTLSPSCTDGSGYSTWSCSVATSDPTLEADITSSSHSLPKGAVISESAPLVWTFTDVPADPIALLTEFKLVDLTSSSGANLFWQIDVNGGAPSAVPEPMTVLPLGAGLLALGLIAGYKRKTN